MSLCSICVSALSEVEKTHEKKIRQGIFPTCYPRHHNFFVSFRNAVQANCLICKVISRTVPQLNANDFMLKSNLSPYEIGFQESLGTEKKRTKLEIHITDQRQNDVPSGAAVRGMQDGTGKITMSCLDRNLVLPIEPQQTVPADFTGANSTLFKLRFWLHQCQSNHKACKDFGVSGKELPSRLLDLKPFDLPNGYFKVIDNHDGDQGIRRYATLSHRWGDWREEAWLLNDLTRERLFTGEAIANLPKTYQDALQVAKFLDVRYFWVDSLCIEQGDNLHIVSEAQKMATVYGNAVFNIAALEARQDGLFSQRQGSAVTPYSVIVDASKYQLRRSYIVLDDGFMNSVFSAPLSQRGWILQEQVLPRRIIYFGKQQIFWSCLENDFCETYPVLNALADLLPHTENSHDMLGVRRICAGIDNVEKDLIPQHWKNLIDQYSLRDLTDPYDRLLAISGLATPFKKLMKDEIVAGHWKSSLPSSLLWTARLSIHSDGRSLSRLRGLPTWFWASCYYPSTFLPDRTERCLAQVTHIETIEPLQNYPKVGNVGSLHLRAVALSVTYSVDQGPNSFNVKLPPGLDASPQNQHYTPPSRNPGQSKLLGGSSEINISAIYDCEDGREVGRNDEQIAAFVSYHATSYTSFDTGIFHGLILRREHGKSTPFQRIGTFRVFINSVHSHLKTPKHPFVQLFLRWRFLQHPSNDPPTLEDEKLPPYDFHAASDILNTYVIA